MRDMEDELRTAEVVNWLPPNSDTAGRALTQSTFQAELEDCKLADVSAEPPFLATARSAQRVEQKAWQQLASRVVSRAWLFLQAKYKTSTAKRLRVSETISLGEKRFVAIVAVEGREFLIGGGTSGMSLLAQLGSAAASASDLGQKLGDVGDVL